MCCFPFSSCDPFKDSHKFSEEGNGNPFQYSCLENPMDREAWWATDHGVARVKYNLSTKPPPPEILSWTRILNTNKTNCKVHFVSALISKQSKSTFQLASE